MNSWGSLRRRPHHRPRRHRLGRDLAAPHCRAEHRCAPYDKKRDYPYPQSVERDIVHELAAVYVPYTGSCFASTTNTETEQFVAANDAHDSGPCEADTETRNGRITSAEVRRHGITLVERPHRAYQSMRHRDGDSIVCS